MMTDTNNQTTILISRGQRISAPIDLRTKDIASNLIIILEPSSSLTLIHGSNSAARNARINRTIRCIVHEHASLTMRYDEQWHESVCAITEIIIEQKTLSTVYYTHFVHAGAQITQRFSLIAAEHTAHTDIRGAYNLMGRGSVTMTTLQYHDAKQTVSNLLFKGIIRDAAQMTHHGTIKITPNGQYTESAQHTHMLLLSDDARALSVPNIEVSTHEVHCGHGSAIGRLDEEHIWYLQARGLSREQAEHCLLDGFFNDVI